MSYIIIPSLVIICYLFAEVYKMIITKEEQKKYIPSLVGIVGGVLGLLTFLISPELLPVSVSAIESVAIGILSGLAATGSNQIFKQLS